MTFWWQPLLKPRSCRSKTSKSATTPKNPSKPPPDPPKPQTPPKTPPFGYDFRKFCDFWSAHYRHFFRFFTFPGTPPGKISKKGSFFGKVVLFEAKTWAKPLKWRFYKGKVPQRAVLTPKSDFLSLFGLFLRATTVLARQSSGWRPERGFIRSFTYKSYLSLAMAMNMAVRYAVACFMKGKTTAFCLH